LHALHIEEMKLDLMVTLLLFLNNNNNKTLNKVGTKGAIMLGETLKTNTSLAELILWGDNKIHI